ncbi:uncharacterized protein LOC119648629 [Hermetia illucens]|uniref:uncharacterized protein LOC119648629 n=1 Tax=Hermetia illucens TaxID=343691 RepID=UPI0018CC6983|nr:uncharacterized protein LOC119648629 [Hermetia illucens]
MYDHVLRIKLPRQATLIGYADDIAIVVADKHLEDVIWACEKSVRLIKDWLVSHRLDLAEHKTEAVLVRGRKLKETLRFCMGQHVKESKGFIKYFGVMLDHRLTFKKHLSYAGEKATKVLGVLSGMVPNIGGPKPPRSLLLARVSSSILLHAAPVWTKVLNVQAYRRKLSSVYRLSALRVATAFRTTSKEAAFVVAGMVSIGILAEEIQTL